MQGTLLDELDILQGTARVQSQIAARPIYHAIYPLRDSCARHRRFGDHEGQQTESGQRIFLDPLTRRMPRKRAVESHTLTAPVGLLGRGQFMQCTGQAVSNRKTQTLQSAKIDR